MPKSTERALKKLRCYANFSVYSNIQ